ncbi:MAG: hypothetical protein WCT53_02520 [Candidatus Gracilibacteria bacterium]
MADTPRPTSETDPIEIELAGGDELEQVIAKLLATPVAGSTDPVKNGSAGSETKTLSVEQEAAEVRGRTSLRFPALSPVTPRTSEPSLALLETATLTELRIPDDRAQLGDGPTKITALSPEEQRKLDLIEELTALEAEVSEHLTKVQMLITGAPDAELDYNAGRTPLAAETTSLLGRASAIQTKATYLGMSAIELSRLADLEARLNAVKPSGSAAAAAAPKGPNEREKREIELDAQITVLEEKLHSLSQNIEAMNDDDSLWRQLLADIKNIMPTINALWEDGNTLLGHVKGEAPILFSRMHECVRNIGIVRGGLATIQTSVIHKQLPLIKADAERIARGWHSLKLETENLLTLEGRTSAALEAQSQKLFAAVYAPEDGGPITNEVLGDVRLLISEGGLDKGVNVPLMASETYLNTVLAESRSLAERVTAEIDRLSAAESAAAAAGTAGEGAPYKPGQELTIEHVDAHTERVSAFWESIRGDTESLLINVFRTIESMVIQKSLLHRLKEKHLATLIGDIDRLTAATSTDHPRIGVLSLANTTLEEISGKIDGLIEKLDAEIERLRAAESPAAPVEPTPPVAPDAAAADPLPPAPVSTPTPIDAAPVPAEEAAPAGLAPLPTLFPADGMYPAEPRTITAGDQLASGEAAQSFFAGAAWETPPAGTGEDDAPYDHDAATFHEDKLEARQNRRRKLVRATGVVALALLTVGIIVDRKMSPDLVDSRDFGKPQGNSDTVKEPVPEQKPAAEALPSLPDSIIAQCIIEVDSTLKCHLEADGLTPKAIAKFGFEPNIDWLPADQQTQRSNNIALGRLNITGRGAEYRGNRTIVGVQQGVRGALVNVQAPGHPILLTRRGR